MIEPCCEYKYAEQNIAPYIKSDRIDRWMEWSGISGTSEGMVAPRSSPDEMDG